MPLGKVCVSCETKSQFSCDHKTSLFNKNLLLGNYLIKLFILEYTYGARRLCLIFNKRLALEKKCLTVTFKSPWTCGDGLSVEGEQLENFRTPGITLFCHFFFKSDPDGSSRLSSQTMYTLWIMFTLVSCGLDRIQRGAIHDSIKVGWLGI